MTLAASGAASTGDLVWIDRLDDPRIADYRHLKDARTRAAYEQSEAIFVVEGRLAVRELLASCFPVRSLLVDDHQLYSAADVVDGVRARGATVYVATRQTLAGVVGFDLHRGVVAVARRRATTDGLSLVDGVLDGDARSERALFALLEGLNDHENLGALFRNAAAFGVAAVLLDPTCADPLYRRCVRVSLGHVLGVPFGSLSPWPDALAALRSRGVQIVALTPRAVDGRARSIEISDLAARPDDGPLALLLGAEGPGLSPAALDAADQIVTIAMPGGIDSLNVATAAAIAFHALAGTAYRSTPSSDPLKALGS